MLSLQRFFINPFNDPAISDEELRAFTEDHLGRLNGLNESGAFTARLAGTTAAFTAFAGTVSDQDLNKALLKAATGQMKLRLKEFKDYMSKGGKARIVDKAGDASALFQEFFPNGLTEYRQATLQEAPVLMDRTVSLVTGENAANGTLLGADFVAKVQELRANFTAARAAQVALKGDTSGEIADRDAARAALELQLFDNLLSLAILHKEEPEMEARYFNESLLKDRENLIPSGSDQFPLHQSLQGK